MYNAGFIHALWADTFLSVAPFPPFRLHALFASRSPTLYRLLAQYPQGGPYHLNINADDKNLSHASLSMALATLYGQTIDARSVDLATAKGLVAAGSLFELEHIARAGYQAILNLLDKETASEILGFALSSIDAQRNGPGRPSSPAVQSQSQANEPTSIDEVDVSYPGPYPPITGNLLQVVVSFIVNNLDASQKPLDPAFQALLVSLPFYLFKTICEHESLRVKSPMERHSFARDVTALREQARRQKGGYGYEENVVLAFGGGKGGVEVIRRPIGKKKTLWKASA